MVVEDPLVFVSSDLFQGRAVLSVFHEVDGDWQYLTSMAPAQDEAQMVHQSHVYEVDATLRELHELPRGKFAVRAGAGRPWSIGDDDNEENGTSSAQEPVAWPYWSVDLPGLSERDAERIVRRAARKQVASGGSVVDPALRLTMHVDHATAHALAEALSAALSGDELSAEDRTISQSTLDTVSEWMARSSGRADGTRR